MKKWQKPQLIALARSKPEEAVLATCKWYQASGPSVVLNVCNYFDWSPPTGGTYCVEGPCALVLPS